ncbi:site-specific integrase [Pseudomonas sp. BIC9C]|uniref:site-specific integrase n=1 Tax=Pseudomonas sp. BIC9C TaxID=3078458 RepID=UPI002AD2E57F|nr:site-specific integrase [Pseudomonas sp. BIC9C]
MPVEAYNRYTRYLFCEKKDHFSRATKKGNHQSTANFFDYLHELGILGAELRPSPRLVEEWVSGYGRFLLEADQSDDLVFRRVAIALGRKPISRKACKAYLYGVNGFLKVDALLEKQQRRLEELLKTPKPHHQPFMPINLSPSSPPSIEASGMIRRNSVLGANLNISHIEVPRATGIFIKERGKNRTRKVKDFPAKYLIETIENMTSARDRCFFAMIGAGGLRFSEALAMPNDLIDIPNKTLRVEDPNDWRQSSKYHGSEQYPYKGRETAIVYLIPELRNYLFEKIIEYKAVRPSSESHLLFVYEQDERYGEPMFCTDIQNLNGLFNYNFKRAQQKTFASLKENDQFKPNYTVHSLRHFYGMWLRNDTYIPGRKQIGLELSEVQVRMGHKLIRSTEIYAYRRQEILNIDYSMSWQLMIGRLGLPNLMEARAVALEALAAHVRSMEKEQRVSHD